MRVKTKLGYVLEGDKFFMDKASSTYWLVWCQHYPNVAILGQSGLKAILPGSANVWIDTK